jgi:hypothetical protein
VGYWGVGPFANDHSGDWSAGFEGADLETGLKRITDALNGTGSGYYPDDLAVAAAEMVAMINLRPAPPIPDQHPGMEGEDEMAANEDALAWIARTQPVSDPRLTELARRAVGRISAPDSDLYRSWFEDEVGVYSAPQWRSYMAGLAARLADS